MSRCKFIDEIRKLKIHSKCKAEILMLYAECSRLAAAIVRFIKRHRRFGETMILGCVIAFLLAQASPLTAAGSAYRKLAHPKTAKGGRQKGLSAP